MSINSRDACRPLGWSARFCTGKMQTWELYCQSTCSGLPSCEVSSWGLHLGSLEPQSQSRTTLPHCHSVVSMPLAIYVCLTSPPNSYVEIVTFNVIVRREGLWEGHQSRALVKEPRQLPRPFHHVRTQWEEMPSMDQEVGSHQSPNLPAPWSWPSSVLHCEKWIAAVFKLLSLWYMCYRSLSRLRQEDTMIPALYPGESWVSVCM